MIPAEEEVTLMISNPGVSPVQLQDELLLGAAEQVEWLRDFAESVSTTCQMDVGDQLGTLTEHQDLVCGVAAKSRDLTELQEGLLRQLGDAEWRNDAGETMEQLQDLVLEFEGAFA